MKETELKVLFASAEKSKSLFNDVISKDDFSLKYLILMDRDEKVKKDYEGIGIEVSFLEDIIKDNVDEDMVDGSVSDINDSIKSDLAERDNNLI